MDEKYLKFGRNKVFRNRDLLAEFLKEYRLFFNPIEAINPTCASCRSKIWTNYIQNINKKPMKKQKINCKYRLKAKYNGIIYNSEPVRNGEMTDELAIEVLKWHPAHELLFDILPEEVEVIKIVDNVAEVVVKKTPPKKKVITKRKPIKKVKIDAVRKPIKRVKVEAKRKPIKRVERKVKK